MGALALEKCPPMEGSTSSLFLFCSLPSSLNHFTSMILAQFTAFVAAFHGFLHNSPQLLLRITIGAGHKMVFLSLFHFSFYDNTVFLIKPICVSAPATLIVVIPIITCAEFSLIYPFFDTIHKIFYACMIFYFFTGIDDFIKTI